MISPLGANCQSSFDAALRGESAVRAAPDELNEGLPGLLMARVEDEAFPDLGKQYAGMDRAVRLALVAVAQAMDDASIAVSPDNGDRFGVFVGIGFGGAQTLDSMYTRSFSRQHAQNRRRATVVHPLSVPRMMANATAAAVSMHYGLRGTSNTYSVACASSAVAAGEAMRAIRNGYLDAAVVVGTEAMLTRGSMVAWNALRVMAKPFPADVSASCRPFDRERSGFVLGEGAAAMVLESRECALRRKVSGRAELAGYGSSSDAHHLTAPSAHGQVAAMRRALTDAELEAGQIQYLNAHGTATETGDVIETESVSEVFGAAAGRLAVSSTKAVHGHLIGAAGTLELALSVLAMESGSIPPTAHLHDVDPRCTLDYVPLHPRHDCRIDAVMSNSFAFGGSNASLIARRIAV